MDRRGFLTTAGALSLAAAAGELRAAEHAFDPTEQSIASLLRALTAGAVTSEALTAAYLKRIARFDHHGPQYRSVLALNPNALKDARALDSERKSGKLRGPLHGIPIIVKDNIETRDPMATTAGSYALANSFRTADAPLAARLRAAGAIILGEGQLERVGKLSLDAFLQRLERNRRPGRQCLRSRAKSVRVERGLRRRRGGEFLCGGDRHRDQWLHPLAVVDQRSGGTQTDGRRGQRQGSGADFAAPGYRGTYVPHGRRCRHCSPG